MDANLEWVTAALSPERLRPYLDACAGRSDAALRLYTWNIQVPSAFDGPLHWFEIVLRNGLHRELERKFGRGDWWHSPSVRLHSHAHERIREAEQQLGRTAANSPAGKLVAELSLGFWVGLVSAGKGMNYETELWRPALRHAFPNYQGRRKPLHQDLYSVLLLRNRMAHREPVHARHLHADHETVIRLIGHLSPEAARHVRRHSRVPEVLACRAAICDGVVQPSF